MTDENRPKRAGGDADEPIPPATPSRALDDWEGDPDDTVVRGPVNPEWYRSDDQSGRASEHFNEKPWVPDDEDTAVRTWARISSPAHALPKHAGSSRVKPSGRRHLRSAFLLTLASAILPGSGLMGSPKITHKVVGALTSIAAIVAGVMVFLRYRANPPRFIAQFTDPSVLRTTMMIMIGLGLIWAILIAATNIATRPAGLSIGKRALSAALVGVLSFAVAAPSALAARYSRDTTLAIEKVAPTGVEEVKSTTRPTLHDHDPWAEVPRLNILILGADGNAARADIVAADSIRTDTIMVASIDTATGDMTLIQVPRNVQYTPFPAGSEMRELFPTGFRGEGGALNWMVNGIWAYVDLQQPDLFRGSTYRGAEALKQGVQGITGLKMDYFVMLNMDGVQELINAMGGVTVNINDNYPIGDDRNPPWSEPSGGWLEKGPNQRLNGYEAMWFARSRSRHSDYDRMARQSCLIDAVVDQANPRNLLQRFEAVAAASSDMIVTDIPQRDFPEMIELAFRVKDGNVNRLGFAPGQNGYSYEDPDFLMMRRAVRDAINPPSATPTPTPTVTATSSASPTETTMGPTETPTETSNPVFGEGAQDVGDACAYKGD